MTETKAPDLLPNYPSKGRRLGPAWNETWQKLMEAPPGEYLDGPELAKEVAQNYNLAPLTVSNLLSKAARKNLLDVEMRRIEGARGPRPRAYYRIAVPS